VYVYVVVRRRANFYLDEALLRGLKELKSHQGIPASEAVRRAVAEYLERQDHAVVKNKTERKRAATRKRS
jgi:metal-responsive CopG/Arc/MetJ family transcriptional regulator